jgi:Tir chaperone protein (CesT) family
MSYREQVDEYLRRFGEAVAVAIPPLDGDGYTQIKRGSATVGINVLEDRGVLMFLSPMMQVPAGKREELYRYLLEKNFLATSDGAFSIDKDTDMVYLRSLRGLEGLEYQEFTDLIDTLGRVADQYDDELASLFGKD